MNDSSRGGFHPQFHYSLPEPYPIPRVVGENSYYASLLLQDYAGMSGELTAINQYLYHYITLQDSHPAISVLARQVAITEMHHFKLLAKLIHLLGELPIMHCVNHGAVRFWNAKYICYGETVYDKLSANIRHETNAIHNYRNHQQHINDPFIQEVLERIILDEQYHLRLFLHFREQVGNNSNHP
jgi:bacterioferritin